MCYISTRNVILKLGYEMTKPNDIIPLNLTLNELEYIFGTLIEKPFKEVNQLVGKLQTQVAEHETKAVKESKKETKKWKNVSKI